MPWKIPQAAVAHGGGVLVNIHTAARRLTADQAHRRIADELIKQPYSIAAATYTSQQRIGKPAPPSPTAGPHLPADNALEIPHNGGGNGWGPSRSPVHNGVSSIRVAHSLMVSLTASFRCTGAALHRVNLGPQQLHAVDVQCLSTGILDAQKTSHSIPHERGGGGGATRAARRRFPQ